MSGALQLRRTTLLALIATLCACNQDDDPLAADLLAAIATTEGSAAGNEWSGTWKWKFDPVRCDCPLSGAASGNFDPCTVTPQATLGGDGTALVLQSDGFLVFESANAQISGAVEANDTFDIAAIFTLTSLLGQAAFYMRMDGEFEGSTQGGDDAEMTARVRQRVIETAELNIDCRSEWTVTATRLSAEP